MESAAGILLADPDLYDIAELPVLFDLWLHRSQKKKKKKLRRRTPPPKPPFRKGFMTPAKRRAQHQSDRDSMGSARTDDEGRGVPRSPPSTAPRHDHTALRRLLANCAAIEDDARDGASDNGHQNDLTANEIAVADALASEDVAHEKLERSVAQCADLERKVGDALAQLDAALQLLGEMRDRLRERTEALARSEARAQAAEARAEELEDAAKKECPVCLEPLETGKAIFTTTCGHAFHFSCLKDCTDKHGHTSPS